MSELLFNNVMVKVKICCISSIEEAKLAIGHGAAAIGLVGRMPSGPKPYSKANLLNLF